MNAALPDPLPAFDAVVLAGGGARRLGGADKPGAVVGGRPLIEWVLDAVRGADRRIVVGPHRDGLPDTVFVREDPPGSGPVPALRAGLAEVRAPWLLLLAADLPFLRRTHVAALLSTAGRAESDGAVLLDDEDREQWLAGCWRTEALRAALDTYDGRSLHRLLSPLRPVTVVTLPVGGRPPWYDCDTPDALAWADRLAGP